MQHVLESHARSALLDFSVENRVPQSMDSISTLFQYIAVPRGLCIRQNNIIVSNPQYTTACPFIRQPCLAGIVFFTDPGPRPDKSQWKAGIVVE